MAGVYERTMETKERDWKPLYRKYNIYRRNEDGSNGEMVDGDNFTLRPSDHHACVALFAYADSVAESNPGLARGLREMVSVEARNNPAIASWLDQYYDHQSEISHLMSRGKELDRMETYGIYVKNLEGESVAKVVCDQDEGVPQSQDEPGQPGWYFWRFATLQEIRDMETDSA